MNRKYRKNSLVGKIYKWVEGQHYDTDSCSVRKVVFWEAPIKLLFKQKLFHFDFLEVDVRIWFVWHTIYQVYVIANWERLFIEKEPVMHDIFIFLLIPVTIFEAIIIVFIVATGIHYVFKMLGRAIKGSVLTPIETKASNLSAPVEDYLSEWWDEIKNKICKPVTWVE